MCPLEILCRLKFGCLTFCWPIHFVIWDGFKHLLFSTTHKVGLSPSNNLWHSPLHMWSTYRLDGDTFYLMFSRRECMTTHNVVWDAFVSITKDVGFYVSHENTHFPITFLLVFALWNDIVFITYRVCTLTNVIITDTIQTYLVLWAIVYQNMAMIIVAQAKDRLYHDWNLEDVLFPFAIIVFYVFMNMLMIFFINVLTWCGELKVIKVILYWYCIHFISKGHH